MSSSRDGAGAGEGGVWAEAGRRQLAHASVIDYNFVVVVFFEFFENRHKKTPKKMKIKQAA